MTEEEIDIIYWAITGHRPHKLGNEYNGVGPYSTYIKSEMRLMIQQASLWNPNPDNFTLITGMALGVDMLWAEIAIEFNYHFIAAIPCKDQEKPWPSSSQKRYNDILNHKLCERYDVSLEPYSKSCMQNRNVWMVNKANMFTAVYDGSISGGTFNCLKYARKTLPEGRIQIIDPRKALL